MASQISHIVYADQCLRSNRGQKVQNEMMFIVGSLYPDIVRLLPSESREYTHGRNRKNHTGIADESFLAGWNFHLYCDKAREYYLKKKKFYDLPQTKDCAYAANKYLEDVLIYSRSSRYDEIASFMRSTSFHNLGTGDAAVTRWYAAVADYIEIEPNTTSLRTILSALNTPIDDADCVIEVMGMLRKNGLAISLLSNASNHLFDFEKEIRGQYNLSP